MPELRPDQCAFFHEHGYLMVENAVDGALLKRLKQDFAAWVEESRAHDAAWGDTVDGRPRFDLEPGHSAKNRAFAGSMRRWRCLRPILRPRWRAAWPTALPS